MCAPLSAFVCVAVVCFVLLNLITLAVLLSNSGKLAVVTPASVENGRITSESSKPTTLLLVVVVILGVEAAVGAVGSIVVYLWARRRGIGQKTNGPQQSGGRYAQPAQQGYVPYRY